MVTFIISSLLDNWSLSLSFSLRKSRTCLVSRTNINLGLGGFKLNTPDTNEQILVCFPTGKPSLYSWKAEIADLWKFIVLYSLPQLKRKVKYSIVSFTGA